MPALIEAFLDPASSTYSYVVYEADGGQCAIVDPVLDYDGAAGRTATTQADKIIAFVRARKLQVQWLLETHAHADHLSAAPYLRQQLGGKIAIGLVDHVAVGRGGGVEKSFNQCGHGHEPVQGWKSQLQHFM